MFSPREGNSGCRVGFYLSYVARGFHDSCPAWIDLWIVLREHSSQAKVNVMNSLVRMVFQLAPSLVIEVILFQLTARWRRKRRCYWPYFMDEKVEVQSGWTFWGSKWRILHLVQCGCNCVFSAWLWAVWFITLYPPCLQNDVSLVLKKGIRWMNKD